MGTESDFKRECEGLVREYFTHGSLSDVEDSLKELLGRPGWIHAQPLRSSLSSSLSRSPLAGFERPPAPLSVTTLRSAVPKRAVIAALDRGTREREMAAQLLAHLRARDVLSRAECEAGFDLLLQELESLAIDVPAAPDELSHFLARAAVDDVISRDFLDECVDASGLDDAPRRVALSARGSVLAPGGEDRAKRAWGGPEGATPAAARREMDHLLREYVSSRDAREASRRLAELHVPFYHHELVKRALTMAIEEARVDPRCPRRVTELLGYLGATGAVSGTQFAKGFARVATALKEVSLDVPDARSLFEGLAADARSKGLLPAGLSAWASIRTGPANDPRVVGGLGDGLGGGRGLRGHLMRLDSAPDLITLAETLSISGGGSAGNESAASPTRRGSTERGTRARYTLARASSRRGDGSSPAVEDAAVEDASLVSPASASCSEAASPVASETPSRTVSPSPPSPSGKSSEPAGARTQSPKPGGVLSAVPPRMSKSNQVDANWSGLRAPRASRRGRGDAQYSGSDSEYARPKPKRPLPDISSGAPSATAKPSPGLGFLVAHTHRPTLGKSAWKARYQPAPARVSGEETTAFKSDASLRKVRSLRRSRSAPGGLQELDNAAHILSIGYVHRHRPFADEYDIGDAIGTGGFAVVRKATHRATGQTYAVKTLRVKAGGGGSDSDSSCDDSSDDDSSDASGDSDEGGGGSGRKLAAMSMAEMTNELIMMQQLSEHPNIVTVKEFYTEDAEGHVTSAVTPASVSGDAVDEKGERSPETHGVVHVVMELLQGQELVDAIVEHGTYQESDAKIVMSNMLDAIAFMHARGVVHRDLKLENLVLARPDNLDSVTLVDFGLAKALMARERAENVCGTLAYVAPEALAAGVYGQGVDVWALGVAMHVLLTGAWPFDDEDEDELMDAIIECDLDFDEGEEWEWISPQAKDLLRGLLEPNPKHRLTAAQALEHEWFTAQPGNATERLHHVHARLDALVGSSRQHPERRFRPGDALATAGKPSEEVFVITAGECEVYAPATGPLAKPGARTRVGRRRKGNLVGEIPRNANPCSGAPVSRLTVEAKTEVRALVFELKDARWATGHDYRLSDEFERALRERRRLLVKQSRLAARAERELRERTGTGPEGGFASSARGGRAMSEITRRP